MKPITKSIIAFAVATLFPMAALAAGTDSPHQGYLVDSPKAGVVMNTTDLCWQTSDWTPARGLDACGRPLKTVAAPAPQAVQVAALEQPKQQSQKISFSGDALFAFDRSELKP